MREARTALGLGRRIKLVQRSGKGGGFFLRQYTRQILVKSGLNSGLGGFQALGLFCGEKQLAPSVVRGVLAGQITLPFQIFGSPGDSRLVCVQQFGQLGLRTAGMVAQRMDEVDLRCADALFRIVSRTSF